MSPTLGPLDVASIPQTPATERHYTVQEVANIWQLSPQKIRRLFQDEPGVLNVAIPRLLKPREGKRSGPKRACLRIPQSVLDRVHQRRSQSGWLAKMQARNRVV